MRKSISFLFIFLLLVSQVSAASYWFSFENKQINKTRYINILNKLTYNQTKNIDNIYIGTNKELPAYAWYAYRYVIRHGKVKKITRSDIYLNYVLDNESDLFIYCTLLHELGHHNELRTKLIPKPSEIYATQWAVDNGCFFDEEDTKFYAFYVNESINLTR